VFAVLVTGPPGAGKTATLIALVDALADDNIAHAAVDVDEVAWAYPYPDLAGRCDYLGAAWAAHRKAGHELLLVAEVVESGEHLAQILGSVEADDHLLVRLEATPATMRERIVDREPPTWSGLEHLVSEMERYAVSLEELDGVHLSLDSEELTPEEIAARIRSERPDRLGG
jgi:broad-specificity NMP kinase